MDRSSKVPEVTLGFWIVKIAATTLGETGGDTLSMSFHLGYAQSSLIFMVLFVAAIGWQMRARVFHPWIYWAAIVSTTLVGTTVADFADRSISIGYLGGSSLLLACVLLALGIWRLSCGTVSAANITSAKVEAFYWVTILASNTLGTALGDFISDGLNFGFAGGALFFCALLTGLVLFYYITDLSRAFLFWAAFILTRPLGATLGDLLIKPSIHGGFDLSRPESSGAIALFIVACLFLLPQRAGSHRGT
ncbi:COG4705 family protein [Acidocella sp.]|uniref:COG4705 family protein n=1 Tax=Acidocella sp. TaxID=50710 RepID=UPI003D08DA57